LKDGGAEHIPSGHYPANAAWFTCAVIAHNLARWTVIIGKHEPVNPTHPDHRRSRRRRQPLRSTHPPVPHPLAMAARLQHRARQPARTSRTLRLNPGPAVRRAAQPTQRHQPEHKANPDQHAPRSTRPINTEPPAPATPKLDSQHQVGGFRLNGPCFRSIGFARWVASKKHIVHIRTRHRAPWTNGRIERWFRSIKYEHLYRRDIADGIALAHHCDDYRTIYNSIRPHQQIDMRRPLELYRQTPTTNQRICPRFLTPNNVTTAPTR
jgi:hypothetical protein